MEQITVKLKRLPGIHFYKDCKKPSWTVDEDETRFKRAVEKAGSGCVCTTNEQKRAEAFAAVEKAIGWQDVVYGS